MIELLRSNDPVLISFVERILADARIGSFIMDMHTSILEGSTSAIPRRIMLADEDLDRARLVLKRHEEIWNDVRILD